MPIENPTVSAVRQMLRGFVLVAVLTGCSGSVVHSGQPGDAGMPDGSDAAPVPDGAVPESDGAVPESDGAVPQPDGAVPQNDGAVPQQDAGPTGPAWELVPLRTQEEKDRGFAGGEMGQMGFSLAISAKDPNRLALGIDTAAVYVSEDAGASWQIRRAGLMSNGVQSVAFDPENADVLFAAGLLSLGCPIAVPPVAACYDSAADGIYRSTDLGRSWQRVHGAAFLRLAGQNEYFAFAGSAGGRSPTVFAITHDQGLVTSPDGGDTWNPVSAAPQGVAGNAILRHPTAGTLWLAANEGLWLSDGGGSWAQAGGGLPADAVLGLVLDPTDASTAYAALGTSGVWKTTDGGSTWAWASTGLPTQSWTRLARGAGGIIYADAGQAGGLYPYRSTNAGASFAAPSAVQDGFYENMHYWSEGMVAHPTDPNVVYMLPPVRVSRDGGQTFQVLGAGVSGSRRTQRTSIAFRPDDPAKMMFIHMDWGAAFTADGGDTWEWRPAPRQDIGLTMAGAAYDPTPGSRRIVSAIGSWDRQRLCVSDDDGLSWNLILANGTSVEAGFTFFAWHPTAPSVIYTGTTEGGLRSEDGGATWQPLSERVRAMFPGNGDVLYALSQPTSSSTRILQSGDRGRTWAPLGADVPVLGEDIDVDPLDQNRVYVAGDSGVWVYDGSSWAGRGAAAGLEADAFGAMPFRVIAADPAQPGVVYAGQRHSWRGVAHGVFRSTDFGQTWQDFNLNFGAELTVWSITVSPQGVAWLGTDHGNFRLR